jgi:hypothetical protein
MTTIFIENCIENDDLIKIVERFGGCAVHRSLRPGENARITLSRSKSILVEAVENEATKPDLGAVWATDPATETWPGFLRRRCG